MPVGFSVAKISGEYDHIPDTCPICHYSSSPVQLTMSLIDRGREKALQIIYRCPRIKCQSAFIATYWQNNNHRSNTPNGIYVLRRTSPSSPQKQKFEESIKAVSPLFVEIYTQASEAEQRGLDQVAGVGFRKALEHLIKDYCISISPEDENLIKATSLGKCIKDHVEDPNIKTCSKRAVWLGNDETHYVRKWEDKDIHDLKSLIHLTMSWIDSSIRTKELLSDMPE